MKEQLKQYLQKFAENKKVVREEDIKEFFLEMESKKRPKVVIPTYCRWNTLLKNFRFLTRTYFHYYEPRDFYFVIILLSGRRCKILLAYPVFMKLYLL